MSWANHTLNNGALIAAVLLATACSDKGESWEWALKPGTYDVAPAFCGSTGEAPEYPTPEHQATLFAFDQLTSHQLIVERHSATEVIADADCQLTLTRTTFQNYDGIFSLRGDRLHTFTPEGCTLAISFQGQSLPIGRSYSELFADHPDDNDEEIPYEVSNDGTALLLTSRDLSSLNELWQAYGCSLPDRLKWRATRAPNSLISKT